MKVNEIFTTIEGETSLTGIPMIFVRFTGCPLRCAYCDTTYAYETGREISISRLMNIIRTSGFSIVHLTGGEPLAQPELPLLMNQLLTEHYQIIIETGGSLDISPFIRNNIRIMLDIKTPGSQMNHHNLLSNIPLMRGGKDEFKFTLCNGDDYDWAVSFLKENQLTNSGCVINFSPVSPGFQPAELAEKIIRDQLPVRLNCQLHRFIWPNRNRGV